MNLNDLRDGNGCPRCVGNQTVYYWSGAHIGIEEILAGGVDSIDEESDAAGWHLWRRVRCKACGAVWHFDFSFPDHPPLFLVGKVVEFEEENQAD